MPIYEYECNGCRKYFQRLILRRDEEAELACPKCASRDLRRLISRVAYHASEGDRLADFDPRARHGDGFYRDSRNIGLHAQKRARQMGVDLGEQFEAKLDRLRTDPGSVIRDTE